MRLFALFGEEKVEPAWEYRSEGILWHVRPTNAGLIVGEERDPQKREVTFFCLNAADGTVVWRKTGLGDTWWTGIESVHDDRLFLHGFHTPDMPQHQGITAVGLGSGDVLWRRPELRFLGIAGGNVVAAESSSLEEAIHRLDPANGATIASTPLASAPLLTDESQELAEPVEFPVPFELLAAEFPRAGSVVRAHLAGVNLAGGPVALLHGNAAIVAYHERTSNGAPETFTHALMIVDIASGKAVFQTALDSGLTALVPESFFLHGDHVYAVKDRQTLTTLFIPREA